MLWLFYLKFDLPTDMIDLTATTPSVDFDY